MVWLLLILLLLYFMISNFLTRFDLLSPLVLSCIMFILSTVFIIPNIRNWNVDLGLCTIITITIGIFSFGFGEILIRLIKRNRRYLAKGTKMVQTVYEPILINKKILIIFIPLLGIVTYYYYQQVLNIADSVGYSTGSSLHMLKFARIATISETGITISTNKLLGQFVILTYAYAHIMLYVLLHNIILCNYKKNILLHILPIIIYFIQIVLTGGRTGFLYLVSSSLIIGIIFYQMRTGWSTINNRRYVKIAVITLLITVIIFFSLGHLTGKTSIFNFIETLSIYFGSSIIALDNFLKSRITNSNNLFGGNTLFGIYDVLRRIGFDIDVLNKAAEFTYIGNYNTNIYTSYMRYIKDFTHFGLILIEFFLGALFSSIYLKIKNEDKPSLLILLYAIIFQVILETAIEERFFMNILSIGYILRFMYISVLYYILINRPKRVKGTSSEEILNENLHGCTFK